MRAAASTPIACLSTWRSSWTTALGKVRRGTGLWTCHGVESVRATVEAALESGVRYLTLYAFSTENWNRPKTRWTP